MEYYPDTMFVEPDFKFKVMPDYWPILLVYERHIENSTELQRDHKMMPEGLNIPKIKTLAHEEIMQKLLVSYKHHHYYQFAI